MILEPKRQMLTPANSAKGMLIDDEWMAGVSEHPENRGQFVAFVLDHRQGERIAETAYPSLEAAVDALNQIPRAWQWESTSGCGSGACGTGECPGVCGTGGSCAPSSETKP
jgi:hypothetical protein